MKRLASNNENEKATMHPLSDSFELETDQERRKLLLRYINRGWLIVGVVTLVALPFYPEQRTQFYFVLALTFPTYLVVWLINRSGSTWLAGVVFSLIVNLGFYGLFLMMIKELGPYQAFDTQATVWMLMGLAIVFAGAFIDKWAAPILALFNTILLIATRFTLAPSSDPRPSIVVFWGILALTIWFYERTLSRTLARTWTELAERRKAQETLIESEQRFRSLSEAAFEGIMIHDQGIILNANKPFADLFGFASPEDLIGKQGLDMLPFAPESRKRIRANQSLGSTEPIEIIIVRPDGSMFPAETQGKDFTFNGQKLRVVAMRDITERKRAQEQLRQTMATLDAIVKASPVGIVSYDLEGRVNTWNEAAEKIFDWKKKEVLGRVAPHIPPAMQPEFHALHRHILNGEILFNVELRRQRKDTTPIDISLNAAPIYDSAGIITGHMAIIQDITERKRADEQIHKLSRAVEQSPASIVITNTAGEIEYVNPKFTRITGYSFEEAQGKNPRILKSGHTTQEEYKRLWETITSGHEWQGEFHNKKKNGEMYWESAVISPISNDRGEVTHFIAVKEDITERKQAEKQLEGYAHNNATLYDLSQKILINSDLDKIYDDIHQAVQNLMACDTFVIALLNEAKQEIAEVFLWDQDRRWPSEHHPAGQGLTGYIISSGKPLRVNEWDESHTELTDSIIFGYTMEHTRSVLAVPLFQTGGQCFGMVSVQSYSSNAYTAEHEQLLVTLANQVSRAMENTQLFNDLRRSHVELSKAYDATIEGWSRAMDLRDKETEGHTQRVTELTLSMVRSMGFAEEEMTHIRRGALLHDIGKIGVPDGILYKTDELTQKEWEILRQHPTYAYEMLSPISYLKPALDIPYCHHEKWDGTGYPQGLKGEQIPLAARIFVVVDVWDAVTNNRPYRSAWSKEQALDYIKQQSGKHFDPQVVDVFLQLIAKV